MVEMMIVLAVVAILILIAIPTLANTSRQSKSVSCRENIFSIQRAAEMYKSARGDYPEDLADLVPKYLKKIPVCPVDNRHEYSFSVGDSGNRFRVVVDCADGGGPHGIEDQDHFSP